MLNVIIVQCSIILLYLVTSSLAIEGIVTTVAGGGLPHIGHVDSCVDGSASVDGSTKTSRFNYPWGILYVSQLNSIFVADCGCVETLHSNDRIRVVDLNRDVVATIAGGKQGYEDGIGTKTKFFHSAGLAMRAENHLLFVADSGNDVIRTINTITMETKTLTGKFSEKGFIDGGIKEARFNNPQQLALSDDGKTLFVADTDNHAIRKINLASGYVDTVTGGPNKEGFTDGRLTVAKFKHPTGMALDSDSNRMYISDHYNHVIRRLDFDTGMVTTIAGTGVPGTPQQSMGKGRQAYLHYPEGLVLDQAYNILYVAEFGNNCIRGIDLNDDTVFVLAGGGAYGSRDAIGLDAQFYHPTDLTLDPTNHVLYVSDQYNHVIRRVTTRGSKEQASRTGMLIDHVISKKAYTDVYVHHRPLVGVLGLIIIGLICVIFFIRKLPKRIKYML